VRRSASLEPALEQLAEAPAAQLLAPAEAHSEVARVAEIEAAGEDKVGAF
jgi:hypothetical protein